MSEQPPPTAEGVGETVGEAKWAAVRDLERRFPGLDKSRVAFQVISEGERGLMGVGREPARVIASLTGPLPAERTGPPAAAPRSRDRDRDRGRNQRPERRRPRPGPRREASLGPEDDSPTAEVARETVLAICAGLGLDAGVHVRKAPDGVVATVQGDELGLLIGKHGHTIDAVEYLVNALVHRRLEDAEHVTVDAQDYRRRREAVLHDAAERAAQTAAASGAPVTMEPMSSAERKVVHLHLKDHDASSPSRPAGSRSAASSSAPAASSPTRRGRTPSTTQSSTPPPPPVAVADGAMATASDAGARARRMHHARTTQAIGRRRRPATRRPRPRGRTRAGFGSCLARGERFRKRGRGRPSAVLRPPRVRPADGEPQRPLAEGTASASARLRNADEVPPLGPRYRARSPRPPRRAAAATTSSGPRSATPV